MRIDTLGRLLLLIVPRRSRKKLILHAVQRKNLGFYLRQEIFRQGDNGAETVTADIGIANGETDVENRQLFYENYRGVGVILIVFYEIIAAA